MIYISSSLIGIIIALYLLLTESDIFSFLNGSSYILGVTEIVKRLLLYFPIFVGAFFLQEKKIKHAEIRIIRYKNVCKWWIVEQLRIFVWIILCYGTMFILFVGRLYRIPGDREVLTMLLLLLHMMFIYISGSYARVFCRTMVVPLICLLTVEVLGMSILTRGIIAPKWNLSAWGISGYEIGQYGNGGFSTGSILMIQIAWILSGIFLYPYVVKRKILWRVANGKYD